MATSSVLSTMAAVGIMLQLLLNYASASPSMKYIDAVCDRAHDQAFCVKTLTSYPPTASPTGLVFILNRELDCFYALGFTFTFLLQLWYLLFSLIIFNILIKIHLTIVNGSAKHAKRASGSQWELPTTSAVLPWRT